MIYRGTSRLNPWLNRAEGLLALSRQVRAVDVAPTLCYLLGIPMPEQVGGGVVYEALEDADWHLR